MGKYIDLHLHTAFSDGTRSPRELLEIVREANLVAFSVADHDSLDGYRAAKKLLVDDDPELITGLELSVSGGGDMHILAYCINPDDDDLNRAIDKFQMNRNQRGGLMVEKLNGLGVAITIEEVKACADGAAIGRPHVARALHRAGAVRTYEEAFEKYLGDNKPAYVPKQNFAPSETIAMIHEAGGVAVLAHPNIDAAFNQLDRLVGMGLDGIEIYHPSCSQRDTDWFKHLAEKYRLIVTGGSDFHGMEDRYGAVGSQRVPAELLAALKQRVQQKRN
ncbi:MAG: PHP domain-containing protein [candidate division Zixibacteria bacterium]|nr:PHP domain-containing protein [candidate division Zixibacteria bacterium]